MDLKEIRDRIDELDDKILDIFVERLELAKLAGEEKRVQKMGIVNQKRQREILTRICDKAGKHDIYANMFFNAMFDISVMYQTANLADEHELGEKIKKAVLNTPVLFPNKSTVACQGVEGAYSQIACDKLFSVANIMYFRNFEAVFSAIESGLCKYGILPLENSSRGSVSEVYELMQRKSFHIVKSIKLKVNHSLLVKPGTNINDIKEIYSHEQAIGQCHEYLKHLTGVKITACENTAVAASMVSASERNDVAAISSSNCADLYGLEILGRNIQDSENNYTRFICISKNLEIYPGANKISLMINLPHEPGSLYRLLGKFNALGLSLIKLESRAIPGEDFTFMFYFDFEASVLDERVIFLLNSLSVNNKSFCFIGNYLEV